MKKSISILAGTVLLVGCSVSQPDVTPIGDGLKAIGISVVVYGVLKALVDLMRADDRKRKMQPPTEGRKVEEPKQPGGGEA